MLRMNWIAAICTGIMVLPAAMATHAEEATTEEGWINPDGPDAEIGGEGPDFSFSILNISTEDGFSAMLGATVSIPVEGRVGASFDVIAGVGDDDPIYGGAARVFWRDPDAGLIGVYGVGAHAEFDGAEYDVFGAGVEGALYLGPVDLEVALGVTTGDGLPDDIVGLASIGFYPIEDVRLSGGARYYTEKLHAAFDVEFTGLSSHGSFFAGGLMSEDEDWQVLAGLKFPVGFGAKSETESVPASEEGSSETERIETQTTDTQSADAQSVDAQSIEAASGPAPAGASLRTRVRTTPRPAAPRSPTLRRRLQRGAFTLTGDAARLARSIALDARQGAVEELEEKCKSAGGAALC